MRIQTWRLALTGGDERIVLAIERCHLGYYPAVLACGLHIVIRCEERGWQRPSAEVGAEIARPYHQVRLVDAEDFRLGNDHLDVKVVLQRTHATVLERGTETREHL